MLILFLFDEARFICKICPRFLSCAVSHDEIFERAADCALAPSQKVSDNKEISQKISLEDYTATLRVAETHTRGLVLFFGLEV